MMRGTKPLFDESTAPVGALLPDAGSNAGGLVTVGDALFYSNAICSSHDRENILRSDDNAKTWTHGALIFAGPSAYSHLAAFSNASEVGLAFERSWTDESQCVGESCSIWWTRVPVNLPLITLPPCP